jgi:hypothetical protein
MARKSKTARQVLDEAMSEEQLQSAVVDLARVQGWRRFHDYDSRRNTAGFPDLVLVRPPRLIFAELKTQRGVVEPEQAEWITDLLACPGPEVYVWRPADWSTIEATLARYPGRVRP